MRVPRLRGQAEIGLLEKYQPHALGEVLFALPVDGLSQAQEEVEKRRQEPLRVGECVALLVDGVYTH